MKISIVIPNYNGEENLRNNLPKVIEAVKNYQSDLEIILTDDSSQDNSIDVAKETIKENNSQIKIKLLISNKNLGFSSNVNRGVNNATGEIVVLLNTDVSPRVGFLDSLISHFSNQNVFAAGCLDESVENGKIIPRGRGVGEWQRGFLVHRAGDLNKNDTLWVSGGSGAFRKSLWDKLGGLNEIYNPFYWEDIDLSYRARKTGFITLFEKESIVRHEHEKGIIKSKFSKNTIKRISYRNQFIFAWINADLSNLIKNILWLPYHLITTLLSGEYLFLIAFFDALLKLPAVIKSRSRNKKTFVKKDLEVVIAK